MNEQTRNEIIHRSFRGQSQREIAKRLHVSRNTIKSVLDDLQSAREGTSIRVDLSSPSVKGVTKTHATQQRATQQRATQKRAAKKRASRLDPYESTLKELLVRYPDMPVVQVQHQLQQVGCDASYTILRQRVKQIRQSVSRGELPPATAPGAVAHALYRDVEIELAERSQRVSHLFVFQLAYSRRAYLRFVPRTDLATTIHEHVSAFEHFSGATASVAYESRSVVEEAHAGEQPTLNPTFLRFASHYGFRPIPGCEPLHENQPWLEQIDREILQGRRFRSLDHANDVLLSWLAAGTRVPAGIRSRSADRHQQETAHLIPLPSNPWRG